MASTTAKKMLWVATVLISTIWQSRATTADVRTGLPDLSTVQRPATKRSSMTRPVRPANVSATSVSSALRVLTHSVPLRSKIALIWLRRLRQTSNVAGSSDTEQTAVAVNPALPPAPSVVTTWTAAPSRHMASRNSGAATGLHMLPPVVISGVPTRSSGNWSIQLIHSTIQEAHARRPGGGYHPVRGWTGSILMRRGYSIARGRLSNRADPALAIGGAPTRACPYLIGSGGTDGLQRTHQLDAPRIT